MTGRLTFVTLPVAELGTAVEFYRTVFGWQPSRRLAVACLFDLASVTVALMERTAYSRFLGLPDAIPHGPGTLCSWNVAAAGAVDEFVQRARQAGATIRRDPAPLDWGGYAGIVETPDGHLWEIVWNPRHAGIPA